MSSERDPLLATPSQHHANTQNLEEARETKKLGPLEVSRSNRWAILGGIWIANLLCVRCTVLCSIHFSKRPGTPVFKQSVHERFFPAFSEPFCGFQLPWWRPVCHETPFYSPLLKFRPSDTVDILRIQQIISSQLARYCVRPGHTLV